MLRFLRKKTENGKKTLCLHIGFFKTGTTSIQIFLGENNEWLAENGYWTGDLHNFAGHDVGTLEKFSSVLQGNLQNSLKQFLASPHNTGVVSSECFPRHINNEKILHWVKNNFTTKILAALRNPVSMREAGYQQAVRALSMGELWGCPSPQEYHWLCEGTFLDHYASIFGKDAVTVLPYDMLREKDGLLQAFAGAIGLPDLDGSRIPERQNERLGYDYLLFLRQSLFLPLPADIRHTLCENLLELSWKNGDKQSFLTIPRENHRFCLRLREYELRHVGREFLHIPDWFEYCLSFLEKQPDPEYAELPLEKQRAIFAQLPAAVQEALDKAMPAKLKPGIVPPLPADSASYMLMNAWIKNSVVRFVEPFVTHR